ncbi:atrial natriuretic peptide receptor 1 isoform X3 [Brienomyrus brachyistius]|uniref:atrial natriuretic peptide receptor 1 isoform X3 n=1 Tax=Brienomyrus brachyistius TaxID=42636 RepID=UPI0020B3840B|nr:atrial natriuretic peptide receptor 1 isoform X3 [Brienomyrus brachyistius]
MEILARAWWLQILLLLVCHGATGLNFTVLLSMPNTSIPFSAGRVGAGALIAIDKVNQDPNLLPGHHLDYKYLDDHCDSVVGPGRIVDLQRTHNFSAFIGPSCSKVCSLIGRLASYWNIAMISPICADQQFLDKKDFSTLTRVFGPFTKMGSFFVRICENFRWKRIGIIYDESPAWNIPAEGIRYSVQNNSITVAKYVGFRDNNNRDASDFAKILQQVAAVSRIIVISARGEVVRRFLIEAHKQGRTNGDFAFFSFEPYKEKQMFGDFSWRRGDPDDSIAKQAFRALFLLSLYKPSNEMYENFSAEVVRRSKENFGYTYDPDEKALHETLLENEDPYDGRNVTRRMWSRTVTGIQGDVTIDDNGDRESAYMMYHSQSSEGVFKVIANYFGTNKTYEQVKGVQIMWPGGRKTPPKDTPTCGFGGELCPFAERTLIISVALILGLLAAGSLTIALLYRKYKLQEKASMMLWMVNLDDVAMTEHHTSSSMFSLNGGSAQDEAASSEVDSEMLSSRTALYKENMCSIRFLNVRSVNLTGDLLAELQQCKDLSHPNICGFVGAWLESPPLFLLTEYCSKGSLQDILRNESIRLDWTFKYSLMLDIVKGMDYLHRSPLRSHGHLSSSNCVVDSRFVLKVTDFGLSSLRRPPGSQNHQNHWQRLLWRAPELLRGTTPHNGTQKGDVYSFGIIVQEIVFRREPFYIPGRTLKAEDIAERVKAGGCSPLRPHVDRAECPEAVETLMRSCWRERPAERPDFPALRTLVKKLSPTGGSDNILDDLLCRMEQYANNLEEVVEERTAQLVQQKKKAESLLTQMLPRSVAAQLIAGQTVQAETYDCVTIYFSDIEGFTVLASSITPMQVVDLLNDLYTNFDKIIDNHDVYKVETIGDAYMVVSGLPIRNGDDHAKEIARMSLAVVRAMEQFENKHVLGQQLKVRIGLHSGPCVAGVVGLKMPRYCLFGDTVNTASRMESHGCPLRIHVSSPTKALLDKFGTFHLELRGTVHMKVRGLPLLSRCCRCNRTAGGIAVHVHIPGEGSCHYILAPGRRAVKNRSTIYTSSRTP